MYSGGRSLAPKLAAQLKELLGKDWQEKRRTDQGYNTFCSNIDLEMVCRIEESLKALVPLETCLRAEGWTTKQIAGFNKNKLRQPFRYVSERFDQAMAQGEANAIKKLSSPDSTQKSCDQHKWMLERMISGNPYAPTTKQQKTVTENKNVTVKMSLDRAVIKQPQLQLVQPIVETEVIEAVPELEKKESK
jgi:hypothetical protein